MSPSEQPKVCAGCGADVTSTQRVKDAKGRYLCAGCVERIRARQGGARRVTNVEGTRATAARVAGPGQGHAPASDQGADLREFMKQAKEAARNQCPSCGVYAQPGAVICLNCGYDARSQSQLQTKFGTARAAKVKGGGGGGGGGFGLALPESDTIIGTIALVYFLFAVVLPVVDVFVLKMGLIALSFAVVFLMSFLLWIFAIIGFMRRADNLFVTLFVVLASLTVWPISVIIAMVYGVCFAESKALRWFSISNVLGFAVCMGLIVYSIVTETPMLPE